jgi:hypothetical protein
MPSSVTTQNVRWNVSTAAITLIDSTASSSTRAFSDRIWPDASTASDTIAHTGNAYWPTVRPAVRNRPLLDRSASSASPKRSCSAHCRKPQVPMTSPRTTRTLSTRARLGVAHERHGDEDGPGEREDHPELGGGLARRQSERDAVQRLQERDGDDEHRGDRGQLLTRSRPASGRVTKTRARPASSRASEGRSPGESRRRRS